MVISVTLLRRSVALEIDRSRIAPLAVPAHRVAVKRAEELRELEVAGV